MLFRFLLLLFLIIVLLGIAIAFGVQRFERLVAQELRTHIPAAHPGELLITEAMLEPLPPVVRNWLQAAGMVGKPDLRTLRIRQTGKMRTEPDGAWMTATAEQYFTADPPAFIWDARVKAGPLTLYGLDRYLDGRGHMLIKLLGLFPVANASGETIDQGTMLRYLAEIVWFPSAALNEYIEWEQVDERTAKATMRYGGISVEGFFRFNADYLPESFEAKRYYDRKEGATLETWVVRNLPEGYKTFNGITIPTKSEVIWKLPAGDFTWFVLEVVEWEGNAVLK